jgi:hypothetical protein
MEILGRGHVDIRKGVNSSNNGDLNLVCRGHDRGGSVKPLSSYEGGLDETFGAKVEMYTLRCELSGVTVGGLVNGGSVEEVIVGEGGTIKQRTPEVTARKESFSRDEKLCRCEDISVV